MKKTSLLVASALLASSALFAQDSVTSNVVGYVTTTLPSGSGTIFAPSLVHPVSASGTLSGVSGTSVTVSGLNSGAYDAGATFPAYYLEITNDTNGSDGLDTEGLVIDIEANTEAAVTAGTDLSALGIQGDESYVIRKHLTLSDFSAGATGFNDFDAITLYNASSVGSIDGYLRYAGGWVDFSFAAANDAVIYPGMGLVINSTGTPQLVITGEVKESATQIPLYAGQVNFVGALKPVSSFDVTSDTALTDATNAFDGVTVYQDGTLTPETSVLVNFTGDGLMDFAMSPTTVSIDGTEDAMVVSVAQSSVYKATGNTISN